jgi:methylglutaconyl-CoA hydratase
VSFIFVSLVFIFLILVRFGWRRDIANRASGETLRSREWKKIENVKQQQEPCCFWHWMTWELRTNAEKTTLTISPHSTRAFLTSLRSVFTLLSTLPVPTISAISSTAFGGGLELALCTNFRVFSSTAIVGLPETRLAIVPGAGGTHRLPALIGETRARDLILTGRRISGPEAYFLGLCDRLVEITEEEANTPGVAREKVLEQAMQFAMDICAGGPLAIGAAMQAVNGWRDGGVSENEAYGRVLTTEDRDEALRAFGEKRKPVFKGR